MKFILTTAGAVALAFSGQYLVQHNWSLQDHFLGGYLSAYLVSVYLKIADTL